MEDVNRLAAENSEEHDQTKDTSLEPRRNKMFARSKIWADEYNGTTWPWVVENRIF